MPSRGVGHVKIATDQLDVKRHEPCRDQRVNERIRTEAVRGEGPVENVDSILAPSAA